MIDPTPAASSPPRRDDLALFFVLACSFTWACALPAAAAFTRHEAPSPGALAGAGLSAFGPSLVAFVLAARQKRLREVFGRWRTPIVWPVLALATPLLIHLVATALYAALGGHPAQWFHPPSKPEQLAALVVFPLGEELGWRGFAHGPMARRFGLVNGSLLLGLVWGLWHLVYSVTPAAAAFDAVLFAMTVLELPLYSLVIAWLFERSNRSLWIAIACHAAAHLDHIELSARTEPWRHVTHMVVLAVVAAFAARSLSRSSPRPA